MRWGAGCTAWRIGWPCRPVLTARGRIVTSVGRLTVCPGSRSPRSVRTTTIGAPRCTKRSARLPERFRLPVVLCYLEGKTHAQAAFELRWGEATLRRRLADARDLLRSRLTRRGVAVSGGALAAALTRQATAAVPTGWAESLARTAVGLPAGSIAAVASRGDRWSAACSSCKLQGIATAALILVAVSMVAPHLVPAGLAARRPRKVAALRPLLRWSRHRRRRCAASARATRRCGRAGANCHGQWPRPRPRRQAVCRGQGLLLSAQSREDDLFAAGPPAPDAISDADGRFRFQIADPGFQTLQVQATWSHPDRRGPGPRIRAGLDVVHHDRRGQGPDAQARPG